MAVTITVDNNRNNNTPVFTADPLIEDESGGTQPSLNPTDDGNDTNITLTGSTLAGLLTPFNNLLNAASLLGQSSLALTLAQKTFAAAVDGASSNSDFIKVETGTGETVTDLYFSDANGQPLNGAQVFISPGVPLQTLNGENIYLYSSGDFAIATTGSTLGAGHTVAAFYLNDSAADHKTASVQMATFEPLSHPNATNPDDAINWTDVLRVSATATKEFNFDGLGSGDHLWVAVGDSAGAVLVTSNTIDVNASGKKTNANIDIHTSQGGDGTTIGIKNQLFDIQGETAVFTLVKSLATLGASGPNATGDYVVDPNPSDAKPEGIDYNGYLNVSGAGIYLSQSQGVPSDAKSFDVVLLNAGPADEEGFGYKTGLSSDGTANFATVTIFASKTATSPIAVWSTNPTGSQVAFGTTVAGVKVTLESGNHIDVDGVFAGYIVDWTSSATFNRFDVITENAPGSNSAPAFDIGKVFVSTPVPGSASVGDKLMVQDDGPILSGSVASVRVEEDELSPNNNPADASAGITDNDAFTDVATYTNAALAAILNAGTDTPATFLLNTSVSGAVLDTGGNAVTSKGDALSWSVNNGVVQAVAGGRVIVTITQTAGAGTPSDPTDDVFTVNLQDQIDHSNASGDTGTKTLDVTSAFSAKDKDGDPADLNGPNNDQRPIQLVIENDVPALSGMIASARVEEDELSPSHNPADLSTGITDNDAFTDVATLSNTALQAVVLPGADEPVTFSLNLSASGAVLDSSGNAVTSHGDALSWSVSSGVVQAVAGGRVILTVAQTAGTGTPNDPTDDVFTVNLQDQIDHANASGDNGTKTLDLTPAFSAKDNDGDAVDLNGAGNDQRPIRLVVENDVPALSGNPASVRVEEDELSTAAPGAGQPPADLSNGITDNDAFTDEATLTNAALQAVVAPGADEPVTFTLNASASGAVLDSSGNAVTSKGDALSWSVSSGVVQAVAGGRVVIAISQTAGANTPNDPTDDTFLVDLRDQIDHSNGAGDDATKTLDLTPAFAAKDFDGDALDLNGAGNDQRPIRLVVENDVPSITAQIQNGAVDFVLNDSVAKSLNGLIGGDDNLAGGQTGTAGLWQYEITGFDNPHNVFPDLTGVISNDGKTLTYYSTSVAANQNASTAVYSLVLDQAGAGTYTFTVLQAPPLSVVNFGFADQPSGQNLFGIIAENKGNVAADGTLPDGGLLFFNDNVHLDANGQYISANNLSSTVNTSQGGGDVSIGYGANNYTANGQDAYFIFADNPSRAAVGGLDLTQTTADDADTVRFNGTITAVTTASVEIVKIVSGTEAGVTIRAFNLDPLNTGTLLNIDTNGEARSLLTDPEAFGGASNDAVSVDINGVKIYSSNTTLTDATLVYSAQDMNNDGDFTDSGEIVKNTGNVTVTENADGSFKVLGLDTDKSYTIQYNTVSPHDMAKVEYEAGSYNLGGFNIIQGQDTPDQTFHFSAKITDYDGDSFGGVNTAISNWSVLVDGTGAFNDPLVG